MVEEKKERRKEEKKEREERVGGESVPCTSTAAEASDRRPSWTCTSAGYNAAVKAELPYARLIPRFRSRQALETLWVWWQLVVFAA